MPGREKLDVRLERYLPKHSVHLYHSLEKKSNVSKTIRFFELGKTILFVHVIKNKQNRSGTMSPMKIL